MLTDEKIGEMLATLAGVQRGQLRCEEQNDFIKNQVGELRADFDRVSSELTTLAAAQTLDDDARKGATTALRVLRVVGIFCTVILLPVTGWLGAEAYEHYMMQVSRIETVRDNGLATGTTLEAHERSVGHEPLRRDVQSNQRSLAAIDTQLRGIETTQNEIQTTQQTLLREVRRSRNWGN